MSRNSNKLILPSPLNQTLALPPPIPENRKDVYDFYKLVFDENGCPLKKTDSGLVFHPILAAYLISEYVLWYEEEHDLKYLDYAHLIAGHALRRAEATDRTMVFNYYPNTGLSSIPQIFYSALTQAWYVKALCQLSQYAAGKYDASIIHVFNSLLVPIEHGGVLIKKEFGWIVEEYPHEPPLYTLNGWLSVLRMIRDSGKTLERLGIDWRSFVDHNLLAVEHLLPLYDASFCNNSRYQLTGFTRVKIVFDRALQHELKSFSVDIPGEGVFVGKKVRENNSRWGNYLERDEMRLLQFNVLLSLVSFPNPNIFRATIAVSHGCKAKIFLADGDYSPSLSGLPTQRWRHIATADLKAAEDTHLTIELPFDDINLFAYPTNFKKRIAGKFYNAYHFIHVINLAELYSLSRKSIYKEYCLKWLEYLERWPAMEFLQLSDYSYISYQYGEDFKNVIQRILNRKMIVVR